MEDACHLLGYRNDALDAHYTGVKGITLPRYRYSISNSLETLSDHELKVALLRIMRWEHSAKELLELRVRAYRINLQEHVLEDAPDPNPYEDITWVAEAYIGVGADRLGMETTYS